MLVELAIDLERTWRAEKRVDVVFLSSEIWIEGIRASSDALRLFVDVMYGGGVPVFVESFVGEGVARAADVLRSSSSAAFFFMRAYQSLLEATPPTPIQPTAAPLPPLPSSFPASLNPGRPNPPSPVHVGAGVSEALAAVAGRSDEGRCGR